MQNRRTFIGTVAGAGALVLTGCSLRGAGNAGGAAAWRAVPEILARIQPPRFADRDFDITTYGATGNGAIDCTTAFRDAIRACNAAGGGRVVVPPGRYLTGPIHLMSNVNLHISRGATIAFDRDPARYLPAVFTRWEGMELFNYSPLIYAFEQNNIAITGEGTLDGQASEQHWWPWKANNVPVSQKPARDRLMRMVEENVPVADRRFGQGDFLRPQFVQPYRCHNILIEGISVINSPMWELHPVLCTNVTVRNVKINTHGPNNDGCNPESCRDVLIDNCDFDTGDDCIAIKSGRNADGRRINIPSENIIVRNCRMKDGHGGVTIGSEVSGGTRNVFVEDCVMDSPNLDRALRLKNNAMRGGVIENIYMRNCRIGEVADAVLSIDFHYEEGAKGAFTPVARNIQMSNITSRKSNHGWVLRGFANAPIYDIHLENCTFDNVAKGNVTEHVRGLNLKNVRINGQETWS